jgi:ribosomal protein S6--L-glutamate ligase
MKFGVLANPISYYARDLTRAIRERGHESLVLPFSGLAAAEPCPATAVWTGDDPAPTALDPFDAILVRTMPPGSLEQVVFRMNALARLEAAGVRVINSARCVESAVDKFLTTFRLRERGLPVPQTWTCETADAAMAAFESAGGDCVVKPLFGSEGRGIVRVTDPETACRVFRTLERIQAVLYVQEFIPHPGWDLRVMVLAGRVLGGMRRYAEEGFRTNVSLGGRSEVVPVSEIEAAWALAATGAVGAHIAGVDILYGPDGKGYVIEVNGVPGWKAFRGATGIDVANELIASLELQ